MPQPTQNTPDTKETDKIIFDFQPSRNVLPQLVNELNFATYLLQNLDMDIPTSKKGETGNLMPHLDYLIPTSKKTDVWFLETMTNLQTILRLAQSHGRPQCIITIQY